MGLKFFLGGLNFLFISSSLYGLVCGCKSEKRSKNSLSIPAKCSKHELEIVVT